LLDVLRPAGKIRFPLEKQPREKQGFIYRVHKSPKTYSEYVLAGLMDELNKPIHPSEELGDWAEIARRHPEVAAKLETRFFGMKSAKGRLARGGK
jgi:hypothetical protein